MERGLEVLETWYRRVWKEKDESAIDELFCAGPARGLDLEKPMGPKEFKDFHKKLFCLLSHIEVVIHKGMEEGVWICALCTLSGKSRSSGEPVEMHGLVMGRIEEGKIKECYNHWDFMGLYAQLGLLPQDGFSRCLCGDKLHARE